MRGVQISYLIEHPEYIPQLAQWLFEQWNTILGEKHRLREVLHPITSRCDSRLRRAWQCDRTHEHPGDFKMW
jgi:hypothetical protein